MKKTELKLLGEMFATTLHKCENVEQRIGVHNTILNFYLLVEKGLLTYEKYAILDKVYRETIEKLEP